MTLQELEGELIRCHSLTDCDEFLRAHLHIIRPIFYGLTRAELWDRRFHYEEAFLAFENSRAGVEIRQGNKPPASVLALLIFFVSLFERAMLYTLIQHVASLLPPGSMRSRAETIFEYKYITDSSKDYEERFDRIVALVQQAWNSCPEGRRSSCQDLLVEYAVDALLARASDVGQRRANIQTLFLDPEARKRNPVLDRAANSIQRVLSLDENELKREQAAVRTRVVDSLHNEACELVPDALILRSAEDLQGEEIPAAQVYDRLPDFLDAQLERMGAAYSPRRQAARLNYELSMEKNRAYLGTYFPRTVIEARNVASELLSIPMISRAMVQKDLVRVLDIGSGTGGAVVGTLLALSDWAPGDLSVEITSIDANEQALSLQRELLESLRGSLRLKVFDHQRQVELPFDLEGFVPAFSSIADHEHSRYDLVLCWKCLSEFYNYQYASANGIIRRMLGIASRMLVPYGLCIVSDVTTTDNRFEFFAMTLNREANEHDGSPEASMRTVLPLPCGRHASTCRESNCYTQRRFVLRHRLARSDETKIAYRVFAPHSFAQSVITTLTEHPAYRVNAARPFEACAGGTIFRDSYACYPCGYTGFFAKEI